MRRIIQRIFTIVILSSTLGIIHGSDDINIAVLELEGNGISPSDLAGLSNRLRTELINTGSFTIIERSKMDEILKEQGFQQTGCTNTECAVEIGQLIGVTKIVLGSVDKVAELYSVNIRLVDVATGKIEVNIADDCDACGLSDVLKVTIHNAARKLVGLPADKTVEKKYAPVAPNTFTTSIQPQKEPIPQQWQQCGIPERYLVRYNTSDYMTFSEWSNKKKRVCLSVGISSVVLGAAGLITFVNSIAQGIDSDSSSSDAGTQIGMGITFNILGVFLIVKARKYKKYITQFNNCTMKTSFKFDY